MFELTIFTKSSILLRCLTRTSSDNCFCTSSILDVWHGFNWLNIFPKSSSWDIWHRFIRQLLSQKASSWMFGWISSVNCVRKMLHHRCLTRINSVNYFCKRLQLRCLTRIPSAICFRKRLHPRCLILDILRSQRDNKLAVNYVKNLLQSPWKITTSMKSAWK